MTTWTRRNFVGAAAALATGAALPARAEGWPTSQVRLISPYGPGGSNDILTRVLAASFAEKLGQPFIVENRTGAGTRIANEFVARAEPDGYTLLHAAAPIAIGEALYPKLPYDAKKDFEPISSTAIAPLFLVVNARAPYRTLAASVRYGKSNPNGLTLGSPGAGSAPHLTAELLFRAADVKGLNIHFRGDANAYNELLAGRIDATLTAIATAVPHIPAGTLLALAVATDARTSVDRRVPTFRELGFPTVVGYGWYGLLAPARTPGAIVQRLNTVANAALADPRIVAKAEAVGVQLRGGTPADFARFIDGETRKWTQVIRAAGITGE